MLRVFVYVFANGVARRVKFSPGSGCLNLNVSGGEKPKEGTESNPVMNLSRDFKKLKI